jgi:adenylate kinase
VDDTLIMRLVSERLDAPDADGGALLDGCTRTRGQAEALESLLGESGLSLVLNIDVPTELVTERLSRRRVCHECGTNYPDDDPSATSGVCAKCGGRVVQRDDDKPDAIRQRLAAYERDTAPLLAFYEERGLLATVNGDQSVEHVAADIQQVLRDRHVL